METRSLDAAAYNVLYDVAQHQHGWAHVMPADRHGAEELIRLGLVQDMAQDGLQTVKATAAGRARATEIWPLSAFAIGTYDAPPGGWTPFEGVAHAPLTPEQRRFLAARQAPGAPVTPAAVDEDAVDRAFAAALKAEAAAAGPAAAADGAGASSRTAIAAGASTDDHAEAPATPPRGFVDNLLAVVDYTLGRARHHLENITDRLEGEVHASVTRRRYRQAQLQAREAMGVLRGRHDCPAATRADWMRIWADAQRNLAGCHEHAPRGRPSFDVDGPSYAERRRQGAELAEALADALTTPLGYPRPSAPAHIERNAGAFLDLLPRAHWRDLDVNDPRSSLNTTINALRPVCGHGVDAIPLLLGQR